MKEKEQGTQVLKTRVPWNSSLLYLSCYNEFESYKFEMLVS